MAERDLDPAGTMPLLDHLRELRRRLLWGFGSILVFALAAYAFAEQLFDVLKAPLIRALGDRAVMIYTAPAEVFMVHVKVALVAGVFAAAPILFYHLWKFIMPGLYPNERRYVVPFVIAASVFFIGGALFGYLVVFPYGFAFFIDKFQTDEIQAMISVENYLRFSIKLLFAFGIAFELPIAIFFLARLGLVTPGFLLRNFRYAFLILACASAFFTPPDAFTMIVMLVPLTGLYLLSTGIAFLVYKRKPKDDGA